jgi:uncharacterized protein YndB with AHSA1/START domain
MGTETILLSAIFPTTAARIYEAWLDANEHSKLTGAVATIEAQVGGKHTAHDGYIWGTILELSPGRRIVQAWRTPDFPADHHDSRLELSFTDVAAGAEVTIAHSSIPEGQGAKYEDGWREFYFKPMATYFVLPNEEPAAKAKPAATKAKHTATKAEHTATKAKHTAPKAKHTAPKAKDTATKAKHTATKAKDTAPKAKHTATKAKHVATKAKHVATKAKRTATKAKKKRR